MAGCAPAMSAGSTRRFPDAVGPFQGRHHLRRHQHLSARGRGSAIDPSRRPRVSAIGVPDPDWGEIVVACVVLEEGRSADDSKLEAHCLASITRFKRPKRYVYLDALPKNNYGRC